ncbi:hypothetical protein GCM10010168_85630 [Actinoplanes ianthinogenes]|uniref:Uncharacterized protein n=1 Tax=Actinoplanes ianthinogenes TaxID=122358 RepID=A0ABM7M168_9ACTN|nr:hypothetical protein [Actinoplanes ianthinogenes]BCJ45294.1 hypothetical protein Aiant_59510 [Actinoplanes ianthinogenes]GGR53606.1 hypothetical protein GCM10010168_85630 [Actinoplanes ianthinogenes]
MTQADHPTHEPAVVFVPATEGEIDARYATLCMDYCTRKGYRFVGIVRTYRDGMRMLYEGTAKVIVAARRDHIDPTDLPRVEFVAEDESPRRASRPYARPETPASPPDASRERRPRQLRRE